MKEVQCTHCKKWFPLKEGLKSHLNDLENDARQIGEKAAKEESKRLLEQNTKLLEENKKKEDLIKSAKTIKEEEVKEARKDEKLKSQVEIEKHKLKLQRTTQSNKQMSKVIEKQKKQIEQGGSADQGSGQEKVLLDYLKDEVFKKNKEDKFSPYGKGVKGGDVLHQIVEKGELIGKILYESKNTDSFDSKWPKKLNEDMSDINADTGIFFTRALPGYFDKDEDYHQNNNIFICKYNYHSLKILAQMNRNFLIGIKKFNKNSEGNKMGVIEFFENPAIKNIFSLMMKQHGGIGTNLKKIKSVAEKTQSDWEDFDKEIQKLLDSLSKAGVFFKK